MKATDYARADEAEILHGEILWLASFGKNTAQISRELHVSVSTVEKHLTGKNPGPEARNRYG